MTSEQTSAQAVFEGLTPGLSYELSVRTRAGGRSSETTTSGRTCECSGRQIHLPGSCSLPESQIRLVPVPQPVSALSMLPINNGKVLKVSWSPPSGYWENYNVLLKNGSDVLVNQTIRKDSTQLAFSSLGLGLVPGRLYGAHVTVQSGGLGNTARCLGRLGQLTFARYCTKEVKSFKHTPFLFDISRHSSPTSGPAAARPSR